MSRRSSGRLAWGLAGLQPVLLVVGVAARLAWGRGDANGPAATAVTGLALLTFAVVGALVVTRVPGNALGWVFLAIALLLGVLPVVGGYADHGLIGDPGSLPGALWVGWVYMWLWFPAVTLILFVPLLYPTGRVPGPAWRWVGRGLGIVCVLGLLGMSVYPGPVGDASRHRPWPPNPIGIEALHGVLDVLQPILELALAAGVLLSLASVAVRFRRSARVERQQLKLMLLAVALLVAVLLASAILPTGLGDFGFAVGTLLVPVAVGVAMLRYRLYDVDRVISRTIVYAVVTAMLAAVYAGLVLGGQQLFASFAGGGNAAVAVSTLVVAALFLPVRANVQSFVDRRFYRRRYDAQRTLVAFGVRVRAEVELGGLARDLRATVADTVEPASQSLWLRRGRT